jgi:phosphatidyl-myo-inositol dimannoside synthase
MPSVSSYVLVTNDYPPRVGGVARYLGELVRYSGGAMRVIVPEGFATSGPGAMTSRRFRRTIWPTWWPIVKICRSLDRERETIVVSHVLPIGTAAWISRLTGGPAYILICHGLDVRLASRNFWKRWLASRIIRSASAVIANSSSTAEAVRALFGRTASVIHPGGARTDLPAREAARMRLGLEDGEYAILAVGRLVERKGIDRLLSAIRMLPPADKIRVVIVGNGPELPILRSLAKDSPHRVEFYPDASDENVAEWYAAADVFCLPTRESAADVEGFGIVYIEAASAGLPVIAAKSGGAAEAVVDGETGLLVDSEDPRDIARALMRVLGDPEIRSRLGSAGRERAFREFRWEDRWGMFKSAVENGRGTVKAES